MNLILFEPEELKKSENESGAVFHIFLKPEDVRSVHLGKILKAGNGAVVDAGVINGKKGKAEVIGINEAGTRLVFTPGNGSAGLAPDNASAGSFKTAYSEKSSEGGNRSGRKQVYFMRN